MKRTDLSSPYQRSRAYSPAVITQGGKIVWLSGHLAWEDEAGNSLTGNFEGQVRCIYQKLKRTLAESGGTLNDIVTMTAFLTDVTNNNQFVEIRKEYFSEDSYPASTLITVASLNRPELLVEINGIAVIS